MYVAFVHYKDTPGLFGCTRLVTVDHVKAINKLIPTFGKHPNSRTKAALKSVRSKA
jgi:hypothetical protein